VIPRGPRAKQAVSAASGLGKPLGMTSMIIPYEDGPLVVRGDFELRTPDGARIDPGRGTVALCRCGKSAIKPFCDGTHRLVGFRAGTGRDTPAPRVESSPGRESSAA
jgi:CDGSH-type Zn-finger protein